MTRMPAPETPQPTRKPRLLSGMQPTDDSLHLGNYLGALVHWVGMQETHDAFYTVVDLHALTVARSRRLLRERTRRTAAQYLAAGVDPDRSHPLRAVHVPEHAELAWVLSCLTGFGEASRMTQFKDKSGKQGGRGPTRRAVHLSGAAWRRTSCCTTPTRSRSGEDQRQHLELTRDLAQALQQPLRRDLHRARAAHRQGDRQDLRPAGPDGQDEQVGGEPERADRLLDDPRSSPSRSGRAVTDAEREIRFDEARSPASPTC